ncbi:hypothetical protein B0T26DRAFT_695426 [Lasiosphaeria miniovina]|uniref:NACHT domain-containing protein n=1 Tax=Lasiosphaeria miniovina TaxID=1954250 RepID=A0AA40B5F5_9PEZI|nr:uncharacterized protein B0T26DRAFT_695426 [Lasiosphaeria miniovina]KAK0727703.1 hypothetical protein B0T26DRAFT_695426 [Lasiosphaeria miniovina]
MAAPVVTSDAPFARALREWVADLKESEDKKSPFYEKVLAAGPEDDGSEPFNARDPQVCSKRLSEFIEKLQQTRRDESKYLRLCARLEPFVDGITRLIKIFGTLAQAAPFEVGIAFAGAQLVLQLASQHVSVFNKMVDIMVEIERQLRCYDKFSVAFSDSADVHSLLLEAYKTIISFWHRASQILSRSSFRIAVSTLIKPLDAEWKNCLEKLQRNSQAVLALTQATTAVESRQNQELDLTKKVAKWILAGEDAAKLLFRRDLAESRSIRHEGTCSWIFNQPSLKTWFGANSNAVAWYTAPPGSGKTVLSAAVAQYVEEKGKGLLIYYRFSFDDSARRMPINALRSIALQLRTAMGKVPEEVMEIFNSEMQRHAYRLQDTEIAANVVEGFLKQVPRIHIVIDGLDECSDIQGALRLFSRLAGFENYGIAKWFFTSRDEPVIQAAMGKMQATELRPAKGTVMSDITTFLDANSANLAVRKCKDCVEYWTAASQENFLYSRLMLQLLCGDGVTCSDEIHEELRRFPPGLSGCYTRCLDSLTRRKDTERELARRMFVFLVFAAKPLTVNELRNALAIRMEPGFDDHQPGRVPSLELIKLLGGSLIRIEHEGSDAGPLVKFVHKSVVDFFKEDPSRLGIPAGRADLGNFFTSRKEGDLLLGRYCLKYLQFRRYQTDVDMPAVLANNNEHAFLKYAAAFWFQHLGEVEHDQELFSEVRSFLRSQAFRTCLSVQVHVRPHLFARYTGIGGGSIFSLGLEAGDLSKDDNITDPLPHWVELYKPDGQDISRALYDFIKDWHEVLVLHPEARNQCQLGQAAKLVFPGLASTMSKGIRVSIIKLPPGAHKAAMSSVYFNKSKASARVTYEGSSKTAAQWHDAPISSGEPSASGQIAFAPPAAGQTKDRKRLIRFTEAANQPATPPTAWSIDLSDLVVERSEGGVESEALHAPKSFHIEGTKSGRTEWGLLKESTPVLSGCGPAVAFHFRNTTLDDMRKQETDSGYDSASDTDADSDSGWSSNSESDSGEASDSEEQTPQQKPKSNASDCLVICCHGEKPVWIPWDNQSNSQTLVSCAFHPREKLAVFSRRLGELELVDMANGEISRLAIEDPAVAGASASVILRELRFSPCGQFLRSLLVLIDDNADVGSTCQVLLSIFEFDGQSRDAGLLSRCAAVQRVTYKFRASTERLRAPFILSHWDVDMLYLCLPLLSCSPKVVRIDVALARHNTSEDVTYAQTLTSPVFFPNSTASRNPRLLYRSSPMDSKDIMLLALDGVFHGEGLGDDGNSYPPVVMEWKISKKDGWKAWDEETDGQESALAEDLRTYSQLRGTFVSAEKRFTVVVRSGLDWTKKAFLSCV